MSPFQNGYKLDSSENVYIRFKGEKKKNPQNMEIKSYSRVIFQLSYCYFFFLNTGDIYRQKENLQRFTSLVELHLCYKTLIASSLFLFFLIFLC